MLSAFKMNIKSLLKYNIFAGLIIATIQISFSQDARTPSKILENADAYFSNQEYKLALGAYKELEEKSSAQEDWEKHVYAFLAQHHVYTILEEESQAEILLGNAEKAFNSYLDASHIYAMYIMNAKAAFSGNQGNYWGSIEAFKEAISFLKNNPETPQYEANLRQLYMNIAVSYANVGDTEQGLSYYQAIWGWT